MSSFLELNLAEPIVSALKECGYLTPTPIQEQAIPRVLAGKDLIATAQTGTGKTAAFVLPCLDNLLNTPRVGRPRILVLTPTRELASQIDTAVQKYGKNARIRTVSVLGGLPYSKQIKELSRPFDILVATPGRLIDHIERERVDLSSIQILILDEADRMLDMGFIEPIQFIASNTPSERQTLLFSATFDKRLAKLANTILRNPERIDISADKMTVDNIEQRLYVADHIKHKYQLLQNILTNDAVAQAIIFVSTKVSADDLSDQLEADGFSATALHGDMKQIVRNRKIEKIRKGKVQLLIATDVAARGIDVPNITHVINFDLPKFAEDYVHRIGRTGRAGQTGIAISFATNQDKHHISKIERFTQKNIAHHVIPGLEPKKPLRNEAPFKSENKRRNFRDKKASANNNAGRSTGGKSFYAPEGRFKKSAPKIEQKKRKWRD